MIRKFNKHSSMDELMAIWLKTNKSAHEFISDSYWDDNYDLVKNLLPSADIYTYTVEDKIVGFIGILDQQYIAGLFVADKYQHQGIGQALIDYCQTNYLSLELDVYTKNSNAINFYFKNSFIITDVKTDDLVNQDEYHMKWTK